MMNDGISKLKRQPGFVGLENSEAQRSEDERSASPTKPADGRIRQSSPDPEVSVKNGHRRFSAAYKIRIVREADACTKVGEIGALLRREALFSSQLTDWRREYRKCIEAALADDKRGCKPTKNHLTDEVERLKRELDRAQKKLKRAETIIEFQKNLSEMLGISPTSVSTEGEK